MAKQRFSVINPLGETVAACVHAVDAAALVGIYGEGAKVKDKMMQILVWREGKEAFSAGNSYDGAAEVMWGRIGAKVDRLAAKLGVTL